MNQSEQLNELFAALSLAQVEFKIAIKDSKNPFFKSTYADLGSVRDAVQGALTKHGLSYLQLTTIDANGNTNLETTIGHKSGQWMRGVYPVHPVKNDPQAMGSAITYARRYALSSMLGVVADEDDDGNAAMPKHKTVNKPDTYMHLDDQKQVIFELMKKYKITDPQIMKEISATLMGKPMSDAENIIKSLAFPLTSLKNDGRIAFKEN